MRKLKIIVLALLLALPKCPMLGQTMEELIAVHKKELAERTQKTSSAKNNSKTSNDWDVYYDSWGISIESGISEGYPIGVNAYHTWGNFLLGAELGGILKSSTYVIEDTEKNYRTKKPNVFVSIYPGVYLKYISIACGVGLQWDREYLEKRTPDISFGEESNGISGSISFSSSSLCPGASFMLRPQMALHIPICDEDYFITLHVGYNYIPKITAMNGMFVGVGFQWTI